MLAIERLDRISEASITNADAIAAGADSRVELMEQLGSSAPDRHLYRIDFRLAGSDPRTELRERSDLREDEIEDLAAQVSRLGRRTVGPGYGYRLLALIGARPAVRAADLAPALGRPVDGLKRDVRRLKDLGLTESLGTGYRVSPRGRALLERIDEGA